jgi:hypothetical protein
VFERYMICTRDFCNAVRDGKVAGFQVKIRINYYRGCYLSMVDTVRLVVDGEEFSSDKMTFTVGGRTYTFGELAKATDARWFFGDTATLTVTKPGGLRPGMHTVQLGLFIRNSYVPQKDPENLFDFFPGTRGSGGATGYGKPPVPLPLAATKKMTLVQ